MADPRYEKLSKVIVQYSTKVTRGEVVAVEVTDIPEEFTISLVREIHKAGGIPIVELKNSRVTRELFRGLSKEGAVMRSTLELAKLKRAHCWIGLRGADNSFEMADVPQESIQTWADASHKAVEYRVDKLRWVILRWPSKGMAQAARMSTEEFEEFFFRTCTIDYHRLDKAMTPLHSLMQKTDKVHIKGPGTDLRFSIKGIGAVKCEGKCNLPDGEVFSAPVKTSVNGIVSFNTPFLYQGRKFENIVLEFSEGKIVRSTSNYSNEWNALLNTDKGGRYLGEFSLGFHPEILHPMGDTLFDEKIAGSLHLTPGRAYKEAWNGNSSKIHLDLVLIQRPEYGGGEVWFDGRLIRKDGEFVTKELKGLNVKALLK